MKKVKDFITRNIVDFVHYLELGVLFIIAIGSIFPTAVTITNPVLFLALILISTKLDVFTSVKRKGQDD